MNKQERMDDFDLLIDDFSSSYPEADLCKLIVDNEPFMEYLIEGGFFTAPASTKYHGAYEGGLYDHSRAVYKRLRQLTTMNELKWKRPESPFIVGMFHDLCKCDQYVGSRDFIQDPIVFQHNDNMLLDGHGEKSVMILSQFITLTEEELLSIRYHMGAYKTDDWKGFDKAIRKTNGLCLFAHTADMLASKVDGV